MPNTDRNRRHVSQSRRPRRHANPLSQRTYAREVILAAALRLYGRKGYAAVTMRALAQEIRCSTGSIYNYFLDKGEIFAHLQESGLRLYAAAVLHTPTDNPLDDLRRFFYRYYEFSQTHPEYFALLWVDPTVPEIDKTLGDYRAVLAAALRLAQRCIDLEPFPSRTSAHAVIQILWSSVHGPAMLRNRQRLSTSFAVEASDSLVNAALDIVLAGFHAGVLLKKPTAAIRKQQ